MDVNNELKFLRTFKKKSGRGGGGGVWVGRVRVDVNEELKFLGKFIKTKKIGGGGGVVEGWVSGVGLGGQGRCERRIEVFVKIQKNRGGGRVWGSGWM